MNIKLENIINAVLQGLEEMGKWIWIGKGWIILLIAAGIITIIAIIIKTITAIK